MNINEKNYLMNSLFFFKSKVDTNEKEKICEWYSNLSLEDRRKVDILRTEAVVEAEFFYGEE